MKLILILATVFVLSVNVCMSEGMSQYSQQTPLPNFEVFEKEEVNSEFKLLDVVLVIASFLIIGGISEE